MSDRDPCETPRAMLSEDLETELLDSAAELERRIAADLARGREAAADDADDDTVADGGRGE